MQLISFLGTGKYFPTTYRFDQDPLSDFKTEYIALAIAKKFQSVEKTRSGDQIRKIDRVTIFATDKAKEAHFESLLDVFEQEGVVTPELVSMPNGENAEEQWEHFSLLLEHIPRGNEQTVVFDITHGFRSQPFFAAAVINYIRSTWSDADVPQMKVLYGEFKRDENDPSKNISSVWDMTTFVNLLDWSSALQGFMKTGHGAALAKLAEQEDRQIRRFATDNRPKKLTGLARSLKEFSENISAVRVPEIITGKGKGSARKVLEMIDASESEVEQFFKPLHPLLFKLKEKLYNLPAVSLFCPEGHRAMLELAKLYVDYERYPEAAIVLREGWVSLYAANDRSSDELLSKAERYAAESRWNDAEGQYSKEGFADKLSTVRNNIQHGGFNTQSTSATALIRNLNELVGEFSNKLGVESDKEQ